MLFVKRGSRFTFSPSDGAAINILDTAGCKMHLVNIYKTKTVSDVGRQVKFFRRGLKLLLNTGAAEMSRVWCKLVIRTNNVAERGTGRDGTGQDIGTLGVCSSGV